MSNELISGNPASNSDVVNEQAMYSAIMYLPLNDLDIKPGDNLQSIIDEADAYAKDPSNSPEDRKNADSYVQTIKGMARELGIDTGSVTMNNPSWDGNSPAYTTPNGLLACTFTNSGGESTMAFRGTPDKAWLDNGYSLASPYGPGGEKASYYYTAPDGNQYGPLSEMDYATLKYAEHVMASGGTYNTTGHSKGGHEAMLVALVFGEQVDTCYSFDGYGVSPELYGNMAYYLGAEFDARRNSIISINGDNDMVNGLGVPLAFDTNTIFLSTVLGGNWSYLHDIRGLIANDGLLNERNPNGQGNISVLFTFVDMILGLDPNGRNQIVLGMMFLAQLAMTGEMPLGGISGNKEAVVAALSIVLVVLVPSIVVFISTGLGAAIITFASSLLLVVGIFVGAVFLYNWLQSLLDGGKHTPIYVLGSSTLIQVETDRMDAYVAQLSPMGSTISQYISRAQSLSDRGSLVGLHVPAGYSTLIGLAEMVRTAMKYLSKTKNSLESAEKKVGSKVPSA